MKTEWNLEILYKGFDDPAYVRDMEAIRESFGRLHALLEERPDPLTPEYVEKLFLTEEEGIKTFELLSIYTGLRQSVNTEDGQCMAESAKQSRIYSEAAGDFAAAEKLLGTIEDVDGFAEKSEVIAGYRYLVEEAKRNAKHLMSNEEESLYAAMDATGAAPGAICRSF
ncbi:MAG: hypothetical protein IKY02_02150 [Lachnospiraceae bacterium]|nr:hypothetical protein [Lachnospiraceae bacterium]